ncbi:hypothetical protein ARAM_005251 [Aspergillus rambellii]|uniref:ABC bile acid transporter n=1 Tax=Aspergillus rambellii TaxID=308745 RepID=A0A0F8VEY5_9EURO|nr:hypothetical protein ARAM_005251 [Aspergillus rambellii]
MGLSSESISLLPGALGFFLVVVGSVPAARSIIDRFSRNGKQQDGSQLAHESYQDEDGEATEESLRAFSDKWQRVAIAFFSIAGFALALSQAILNSVHLSIHSPARLWILVGVWLLLIVQAIAFFTESCPTRRFDLGLWGFGASVLTVTIPGVEFCISSSVRYHLAHEQLSTGLLCAQLGAALLRGVFCLSLPRRPEVYLNGKIVDLQNSVSFLSRFSFTWPGKLLAYTIKNKNISIDALPVLPFAVRSKTLHTRFEQFRDPTKKLWRTLIGFHYRSFVVQSILTFINCVLSFAPQITLYGILRSMEARDAALPGQEQPWPWVIALGVLMFFASSVESWLFWVIYSEIGIPIYAELAAVIFAKSMRRKDVKSTKKSKQAGTSESNPAGDPAEEEDEEQLLKKSRQSTISLVAVDARRISDFASFNYLIPSSLIKILIACGLLIQLIGWKPLACGLAVSALITPVNVQLAKRFTNTQGVLMKRRDEKVAVVTEALQAIRQIKFSALESQWQKKIQDIRNNELDALWSAFRYDIGLILLWILGPLMLSAVSLAAYALMHGELTASVAFTAISIFGSLELSLAFVPELVTKGLEAKVSADRIDEYLFSSEKTNKTLPANAISFDNASVAWPSNEEPGEADTEPRFVLQNLNISFPAKGLSVISGRTGSGKSLLLASVLGECEILHGTVRVPTPPPLKERYDHLANDENWIIDNAIAYVGQIPWVENASIRDNILFGLPYNKTRYENVLFACALEKDLQVLPDGEMTDIGANGVNLSGGQKWRMSFARALYSRAGILVMDDIFSALDAQTGRHVYEHALTGSLGHNRTRILVTHHVALCLPRTDYSVLLEDGKPKHAGTIAELRRTNSLADILLQDEDAERFNHPAREDQECVNEENAGQKDITNRPRRSTSTSVGRNGTAPHDDSKPKKFVQEEKRETGSINFSVYLTYFKSGAGLPHWLLIIFAYILYSGLIVGRAWWVNIWTSSVEHHSNQNHYATFMTQAMQRFATVKTSDSLGFYLGIYVGLSIIACSVGTVRYFLVLSSAVRASKNLFETLTFAMLRAPLRWLDTVPLGRILNRFTSDFHAIDSRLGYDLGFVINKFLEVIGIMIAGMLASPRLILFAVILLALCLQLSLTYLAGAREVKRLESTAKSPVFELFDSSLVGLITIRAFTKADTYLDIMYQKIDRHAGAWWNLLLFNRWLGFRMGVVGALFSTITAVLVVYLPGITASLAGFALSFALQYNSAVSAALRQYSNVELNMNATERVIEYSKIQIESQDGTSPPAAWPTEGQLEVEDLVVSYAPELPPVLNGLSFTVTKHQRVGIVGRTGAGKSSLALALFRFLEARQGHIYIDGIDVFKIKLHDLRSRLAIIPQDPVLFSGTVRSNLDPFDEYGDSELYDALERVHLISADENKTLSQPATDASSTSLVKPTNAFKSLSSPISEGGLNLSQGQRQLLCLARAIVSRPKIMVLDEATSAVDMETDMLIQQSIRAEFKATTLLVIAHRLSTIVDFDRVLVMDTGRVAEFGTPQELMKIEQGIFKNLVENSGEKTVLEQIIFGEAGEARRTRMR